MRISNSGANKYLGCGASYKLHYVDKWRSKFKSSALFFGTAIDAACNYLLENLNGDNNLSKAIAIFESNWEQQIDKDTKEAIDLPKNPFIKYFKSDFDLELLTEEDLTRLEYKSIPDLVSFRHGVDEKLKNGGAFSLEEMGEYNYMNWLCLLHKGRLMVEAYHREILPKFKRVLALQKPISVSFTDDRTNETDEISGIAEFVAELQDGTICLVDNKTAGTPYTPDSVSKSQQLALYKSILNILAENKADGWETKIDKCAYAVVSKKVVKTTTKTCLKCGNVATSSHKTCNSTNTNSGKRCDGQWDEKVTFNTPTQFIIDNISDEFGQSVLENMVNITRAVKNNIFPKNYERCYNDYGGVCPYIGICHKKGKPSDDLFQLEEVKNG